jgi:hypothetical protein
LAGAFLYGKISNSKIEESCSLKSSEHFLGPTFVLRLLSADNHASVSKVEIKAKKIEIFQFFGDFFKIGGLKVKCLCFFDASNKT